MAAGRGDADSYVTLDYAGLMKSLSLAPVNGSAVGYAVLKVKALSEGNTALELSLNNAEENVASLTATDGWQYAVFDLTQGGFTGDLTTLRIGWVGNGDTTYLADVFFVSTEEQVNALTAGAYIFPAQERLNTDEPETTTEDETDTPTEPAETVGGTEVPTKPTDTTVPSDSIEANSETDPVTEPQKSGCASVLALTSLVGVTVAGAVLMTSRKRKD